MAELLPTWSKDIFKNNRAQTAIWLYLKRQLMLILQLTVNFVLAQREASHNFLQIKKINLRDWY